MKFEYHTKGTCSRNIILEMDGDTGTEGTGCHPENSGHHLRS